MGNCNSIKTENSPEKIVKTISFIIVIFIIYIILYFFTFTAYLKSNTEIHCNPLFMMFSDIFGISSSTNMNECLNNLHRENIEEQTYETKNKTDELEEKHQNLNNKSNNISSKLLGMGDVMGNLMSGMTVMLAGTLVEGQNLMLKLKAVSNKLFTSMSVLSNISQTGLKTGESIVNGPVMGTLKTMEKFCFDKDTKITLKNKDVVTIKDIKLGDVIENGSLVVGKVELVNHIKEHLYEIKTNNSESIFVTGSHLILDNETNKFIYVENSNLSKKTSIVPEKLYCLITNDHIIKIGDLTFWDYDD